MADISGYLNVIKTASSGDTVRDAIVNCMRAINDDAAVKTTSLIITKADNVTYKPGTGKAFRSVTVNINGSGESNPSKTINYETFNVTESTENGEYTPENENTYYDKVNVNIDWDTVSHPVGLLEEAEMIDVGTDETTGRKYWDANWAGGNYVKRIWISNAAASQLPDYPGGSGGNGPFNVTFYDRQKAYGSPNKLVTIQVPYGGDASKAYKEQSLSSSGVPYPTYGGTFMRWDPNPTNVKQHTSAFAVYVDPDSGVGEGEISDSWEKIVLGSTNYQIGQWKWLDVKASDDGRITIPDITLTSKCYSGAEHATKSITNAHIKYMIRMQIVAQGEGGSATTWLAMDPLPNTYIDNNSGDGIYKNAGGTDDWDSCYFQQFLNNSVYNALPAVIKTNIEPVAKTFWGINQYPPTTGARQRTRKTQEYALWLPSLGEISSLFPSSEWPTTSSPYPPEFRDGETGSVAYTHWTPQILDNTVSGSKSLAVRSLVRVNEYGGALGMYSSNGVQKWLQATTLPGAFSSGDGIYIGFCLRV